MTSHLCHNIYHARKVVGIWNVANPLGMFIYKYHYTCPFLTLMQVGVCIYTHLYY